MNKSQLQDLGIVNEQLGLMQQETDLLKTTLLSCELQARRVEEELSASRLKIKNVKVAAWTSIGVGCLCIVTPCLIRPGEQAEWKHVLTGIGVAAAVTGVAVRVTLFF